MFHDVVTIGKGGGEMEVLLHQQDGETLRLEHADRAPDLLDDDGSQSFSRLVKQQKPRPGAQDAADRQHLLLAAGKLGALARQPFAQIGEQFEDAVEIEPAGPHLARQQQIFLDVETGENAALFRAKGDAGAGDGVGGPPDQFVAFKAHRAGAAFYDAHDGLERSALADAVAAEERHHFARPHLEIDAMQHMQFPVPGFKLVHSEQRGGFKHGRSRIGLAHGRIGRNRLIVALGQHLPARQHGDPVAQIGNDAEIVLDHKHGAGNGDCSDQRADAHDVLAAHAGHRLVEQEQFGLERERGRDFQRPLAAIRQFDRQRIDIRRQPDIGDDFLGPVFERRSAHVSTARNRMNCRAGVAARCAHFPAR